MSRVLPACVCLEEASPLSSVVLWPGASVLHLSYWGFVEPWGLGVSRFHELERSQLLHLRHGCGSGHSALMLCFPDPSAVSGLMCLSA